MTAGGSNWNPASQGVAAELLRIWSVLIPAIGELGKIFGEEGVPFDVKSIQVWRVEYSSKEERTVAPVEIAELQPGTVLFLNMTLLFQGRQVTTMTTVYIDDSQMANVVVTDIPEFEIDPEDVTDNKLTDEIVGKIRELLSGIPTFTTAFLAMLIKTRKGKPGAGSGA